jgi:hypothetical protein
MSGYRKNKEELAAIIQRLSANKKRSIDLQAEAEIEITQARNKQESVARENNTLKYLEEEKARKKRLGLTRPEA